jgi:hypothetical protein
MYPSGGLYGKDFPEEVNIEGFRRISGHYIYI